MILSISELFGKKLFNHVNFIVFCKCSPDKPTASTHRHRSSASWRNAIEGYWRSRMPNAGSRTGGEVCSGFTEGGFRWRVSCLKILRVSFSLTLNCHFGIPWGTFIMNKPRSLLPPGGEWRALAVAGRVRSTAGEAGVTRVTDFIGGLFAGEIGMPPCCHCPA